MFHFICSENIFRILRLQKLSFQALLAMETSNNINPIFYGFFKQLLRIPHLKESIDCLRPGAIIHASFLVLRKWKRIRIILNWIKINYIYHSTILKPIALTEWKYIENNDYDHSLGFFKRRVNSNNLLHDHFVSVHNSRFALKYYTFVAKPRQLNI